MKGMFGSRGVNAGSVVGRVTMQAQQMAGKADVTKDENFEQLKVLFQSVCLNAVANEGNLLLHRNSVINGIAAYDGVLQAASDLFPEDEQDALTIFEQASSALSEGVKEQFEEKFEERVSGPIKKYRMDLDMINSKVTQRGSMRLDFDAAKAALAKIQKKGSGGQKLQKAERTCEQTGMMYNMINQEAMSRMQFHIADKVRFWSLMMKGVLECEATACAATNKAVVPQIKAMNAWIQNGTPAPAPAPSAPAAAPDSAPASTFGAPSGGGGGFGGAGGFGEPAGGGSGGGGGLYDQPAGGGNIYGEPASGGGGGLYDEPAAGGGGNIYGEPVGGGGGGGGGNIYGDAGGGGAAPAASGGMFAGMETAADPFANPAPAAAAAPAPAPAPPPAPAAAPAPPPPPAPAAAAPPAAGGDPWDQMFGAADGGGGGFDFGAPAATGDGGGSAI